MREPGQGISGSVIAVHCPSCGAPTPASLVSTQALRCQSCGYSGPPSAKARTHLDELGQLLLKFDVRERQLSSAQRRALLSSRLFRGLFWFLAGNVALPAISSAVYFSIVPFPTGADVALAGGVGVPLLLMAGGGLAAVWLVLRRGARLLEACAGLPPLATGEPARCHVCAGPVSAAAGASIARCGYCSADNFVSPEALERSRASRWAAAEEVEAEVRRQASAASQATLGWAGTLSLLMMLFSPLLLAGSFGLAASGLSRAELSLDEAREYALWTDSGRDCYGEVERGAAGSTILSFGPERAPGFPAKVTLPAGSPVASIPGRALQGQLIRLTGLDVGPVAKVYRRAFHFDNAIRVQGPQGWRARPIRGACVPGPKGAVALHALQAFSGPMAGDGSAAYAADNANQRGLLIRVPTPEGAVSQLASTPTPILDVQLGGDEVYYSVHDSIWAVPKAGGAPRRIHSSTQVEFAVDATDLYTSGYEATASGYAFRKTPRGGGAPITLATHSEMPCELAEHEDHLYWFTCTREMSFGGGTLLQVAKSGGAVEVLGTRVLRPAQGSRPVFDGNRLFWLAQERGQYAVLALPIEGGEVTTLAKPSSPKGFSGEPGYLYWGRYQGIERIPTGGGAIEKIALPAGGSSCTALAVFPDSIVYSDDSTHRLVRMPR